MIRQKMRLALLFAVVSVHVYQASAGSLGCYIDDPNIRDLEHSYVVGDRMKASTCNQYCRYSKNYRYGGAQLKECNCGDTYGSYGVGGGCTAKCPADPREGCGGVNRNQMYDLAPFAQASSPEIAFINDGETYNAGCKFSYALPGALYKVQFLADDKVIDTQELRGESRVKHTIHSLIGINKIRQVMGQMVHCRVWSKFVAAPHNTTTYAQHEEKVSEPMIFGVKITRSEDGSVVNAASPLKVYEGMAAEKVELKLTVPPVNTLKINLRITGTKMTCPYTNEEMDQVVLDTCTLTFTKEGAETQEVGVQAVEDYKDDNTVNANVMIDVAEPGPPANDSNNPFETDSEIGGFPVEAGDLPPVVPPTPGSGTCNSQNDPHMKTFDGKRYDCQLEGEFILYKHAVEPFEVHTYYKRCNSKAMCNCAVSVRVGDDVILVDKCGATNPQHRKPVTVHKYSSSDNKFAENFNIVTLQGGRQYIINMPHGGRVKVLYEGSMFMNVYMNPGASDRGNARGLCGNYDNRIGNDFKKPDGSNAADTFRPNAFSLSWRVPAANSMFNGKVPAGSVTYGVTTTQKAEAICSCKAGEAEGTCTAAPDMRCQKPGEPVPEIEIGKPDVTGPPFGPVDPNYRPPVPKWPSGGITEEEARKFCEDTLNNSPASTMCKNVPGLKEEAIENCMEVIKLSGEKVWAQTAVEGFKENCQNVIDVNPNPEPTDGHFCPNDCSGNGKCGADNVCTCNAGFTCIDCSCKENEAPEVFANPLCCDVKNNSDCQYFTVGGVFDDSIKYSCKLTYDGQEKVVDGRYVKFDTLRCDFKSVDFVAYAGKDMAVSVIVGVSESEPQPVGVYHSGCMSCNDNDGTVTREDDKCYIATKRACVNARSTNPLVQTEACDPGKNPDGYTSTDPCDGAGCSNGCKNKNGAAMCTCPLNMVLGEDRKTCISPCDGAGCTGDCEVQNKAAVCTCPENMVLGDDAKTCTNPCEINNGDCDELSLCQVVNGTVQCPCKEGIILNQDDKCEHPCDSENNPCEQVCTKVENGEEVYECSCNEGWVEGPEGCVDPCKDIGCSDMCEVEDGKAVCTCPVDMALGDDVKTCKPRSPCDDAGCSDGCGTIDGAAVCTCPGNLVLGEDMATCINPCENAGCQQGCQVEDNVMVCTCPDGFKLKEDGVGCKVKGDCEDNGGTEVCNCPDSMIFAVDKKTCIESCAKAGCSNICDVVDNVAVCSCPEQSGMVLGDDQKTCQLADPCEGAGCGDRCSDNGDGDAECSCTIEGMVIGADQKTCSKDPDVDECSLDIDAGTCRAVLMRWAYFDKDVGCVEFQYGGCGGNTNNFPSKEDCEKTCPRNPCESAGCTNDCEVQNNAAVCTCPEDMFLGDDAKTCTEKVHPCDVNRGGCEHECERVGDQAVCRCHEGFAPAGNRCKDVNECKGDNPCQHTCENTIGSFTCSCPEDKELRVDGTTCQDIALNPCDECSHTCDHKDGQLVKCTCPNGYELAQDDRQCIDINECENNNGGCEMDCYNQPGTHSCQCVVPCLPGYTQVKDRCVDSCEINNGGCEFICGHADDGEIECSCPNDGLVDPVNSTKCFSPCNGKGEGGGCDKYCEATENFVRTCSCDEGEILAVDGQSCGNRRCAQGFVREGTECAPVCQVNNGGCKEGQTCDVVEATVVCSCPEGEVMTTADDCVPQCEEGERMNMTNGDCEDINECEEDTDGCEQQCENTEPGFECSCDEGELDINGKTCTNINPCDTENGECEHKCAHVGHEKYECLCDDGFELNADKHSCDSLCDKDNGGCGENEQCELNGRGEVGCKCKPGMFEQEDRSCVHPCDAADNPCEQVCNKVDEGEEPYECSCGPGYEDVDGECVDGCDNHGCAGTCENLENGAFKCGCPEGEILDADDKTCKDKNECDEFNGGCSETCVNDAPGHHCECPEPKELDVDRKTCIDYDACEEDKPCGHICENRDGREFVCTCRNGFELADDKTTCLDKCNVDNGGCQHNCDHIEDGTVVCTCREDFRLQQDGKSCEEIDQCAEGTDDCDGTCENTVPGYICHCPEGFRLGTDKKKCEAVDPCTIDNGGCSHTCTTTDLESECSCPDTMVLGEDLETCIHKCDVLNNGCDQGCNRQDAECFCNQGWELDQDGKSCHDINECDRNEDGCQQTCDNEQGKFSCSCEAGFRINVDDDTKCDDIDECQTNNGGCRQKCENLIGGYRCECDDVEWLCSEGYIRDPETDMCHDVNECDDLNRCPVGKQCENTVGSFTCSDLPGPNC